MSRADDIARVWRKNPFALAPPVLAMGTWFVGLVLAHVVPGVGDWPYALPFIVLAGWAAALHRRLWRHVPTRRQVAGRDAESAATLLARSPLGAGVLGAVGMAGYFLVVATVFREPWLGAEAASRTYAIALMGIAVGLLGWEIVFGDAARRRERHEQSRHRAGKDRRGDG
jgi:hypothetical protein